MDCRDQIEDLRKQFICGTGITCLKWKNILEIIKRNPEEFQQLIMDTTVNSELILKYPIQTSYQKAFLKELMNNLEQEGIEIICAVYSSYGRLVSLPEQCHYYKHYIFTDEEEKVITLKESVNLICNGTTGLRTWQAALVLSEWSLQNKEFFTNNAVLELGSGAGLTGLVIFKECAPEIFYLTDCNENVLEKLKENVTLNLDDHYSRYMTKIDEKCIYSHCSRNQTTLSIWNLPWEDVNEAICDKLGKLDKVIAADVVYDSELFEALINALKNLSQFCEVDEFIFCCTVRNPSTLDEFLEKIDNAGFNTELLDTPLSKHFTLPTDSVKIYSFIAKETCS